MATRSFANKEFRSLASTIANGLALRQGNGHSILKDSSLPSIDSSRNMIFTRTIRTWKSYARPKFVLYGASMTEFSFIADGWGASLAHLYRRKADIVLRGYLGWNTRRALGALDKIFPKDAEVQPELVVVFFGANDAAFPMPSGRGQHVPLPEFEDNLCRVAKHLQGLSEKTRVILTSAPPIYEAARLKWGRMEHGEKGGKFLDRTNERAGMYAAACGSAARKVGAGNIDLWTSIQQQPDWQTACLTPDGMHLSAQGSAVMLKQLLNVLKGATWQPCLHYDAMPEDLCEPSIYDTVHPCIEDVEAARVEAAKFSL